MLNQYRGCLIGLAVGDVLGAPFEFWTQAEIIEYLTDNDLAVREFVRGDKKLPAGFYTDDTAQTICLAESLIEKGFNPADQFKRYRQWYLNGYATPLGSCYGIGQQTMKALMNGKPPDANSSDPQAGGNGSLMRCAPLGLYYQGDYREIKEKSLLVSYVTHNYQLAGWAGVILNAIISLIIKGKEDRGSILNQVSGIYNDNPLEIKELLLIDYNKIKEYSYPITGYCVDTLRIALWAWLTSNDYRETIKKVILLGNDTDTFGAVAGALAGCYYGYEDIPNDWKEKVLKKEYLLELAENLIRQ